MGLNAERRAGKYRAMANTTAILFPGQGSHTDDMREVVERFEPELAELVLAELDEDPFARAGEATRFAQPAILCAGLAFWTAAGRPRGSYFTGHSLGELTALAAAGAIAPSDAARLALIRGRLMDEAAKASPGGMLAVLGDSAVAVEIATATGLVVANDNGPTQKVLAGPREAVVDARIAAKARGVRTIELQVAGGFHSPAMEPAVEPFRAALDATKVAEPVTPFVSCSLVEELSAPDRIRDALSRALVRPVRWGETLEWLRARGVDFFLEAGPGKALTGMVRRALDGVEAAVLKPEEVARA